MSEAQVLERDSFIANRCISSSPTVHVVLVKLARAVSGLRKVGHDTVHANAVFISRVASHVRPVPLERHGHLPEVLRYIVEGLVELAHSHGVHVVDAVGFDAGGVGETTLLLEHLRGHGGRTILLVHRGICL
jgi:hypothetical protein